MKRFILFGIGRSGSTLLANLLNLHPLIHCDGELLRPGRWQHRRSFLLPLLRRYPWPYVYSRQLAVRYLKHRSVYGFKLHVQQIDDARTFLSQANTSGWRIIHLERESIFDQLISALVAVHTGRFHGDDSRPEATISPFIIDVDDFLTMLRIRRDRLQRCRSAVATVPHLQVVYETDLRSPIYWHKAVSRICNYLEIPMTDRLLQPKVRSRGKR
jgi:LPS sulfotransferase NodH